MRSAAVEHLVAVEDGRVHETELARRKGDEVLLAEPMQHEPTFMVVIEIQQADLAAFGEVRVDDQSQSSSGLTKSGPEIQTLPAEMRAT